MRAISLGLIILCEILIVLSRGANVSGASLKFMTTLILVVLVAFSISALLGNIKSMALSRNYLVSGIAGIISGVSYYLWVGERLDALLLWLSAYGLYALLIIILVASLILFFYGGKPEEIDTDEAS